MYPAPSPDRLDVIRRMPDITNTTDTRIGIVHKLTYFLFRIVSVRDHCTSMTYICDDLVKDL